jgi:reactive intermediate/imine deaminase
MKSAPVVAIALAAVLLGGCRTARPAASTPAYFPSPEAALRALPFSEAVRAGDFLFLSGQIGNLPGSLQVEPGGIGPEAARALENIRAILERHAASLDDVVKCTVFLADMHDWPAFNEVYRKVFNRNFPARSALGASGLAVGARVEVECVAYVPARP